LFTVLSIEEELIFVYQYGLVITLYVIVNPIEKAPMIPILGNKFNLCFITIADAILAPATHTAAEATVLNK
jgi:hypothetical protein